MSTVRIQVRRGTASQWTSVNPILAAGEMGVESDSNLFKFGNGSSTWTALAYANNSDVAIGEISQDAINTALTMGTGLTKTYNDGANSITITVDSDVVALKSYVDSQITGLSNTVDSDFIPMSDRGTAGGVASLDNSGKIPSTQLDITETVQDVVAAEIVAGTNIVKSYDDAGGYVNLSVSNSPSFSGTLNAPTINATNLDVATGLTAANVIISGNLTVNGTTSTVNSTSFSVDDPMIYIGENNQSNVLDLGLVAAFNDGTYQHSGLVKDASDSGRWKLFSGVTAEPGTTVDFSTYTRDDLQVGGLYATSAVIGEVVNAEIQTLDGINTTKTIQAQLNERLTSATAATTYATIANDELKAPKNSPTFTGTVTLPDNTITQSMMSDDSVGTNEIGGYAVTSAKIADGAITLAKIADGVISSAKLADGSVTSSKIGTSEVISGKIANGAVTSTKIAATAVQTSHIEDGAVTSAKIADGTITSADLADDAVTSAKITDGSVTTSELADGAVTSAKILNGSIADIDINASAEIAPTKIAGEALTKANTGDITNAMLAGFIDQSKITNLTTDLAAKAPLAAPTFTGTVVLPATTSIGNVSATEIGYVDGVTSAIQTQLDSKLATATAASTYLASATAASTYATIVNDNLKAPIASPTFTGTVSGVTKSMVGLGNVDNTTDAAKPVSTATQTALDLKAPKAAPTFTGTLTAADVTISGNLTVSGTTTTVNTTNFTTSDPVIYLGDGNNANLVDIGFVGSYNDGTYAHQGLVKDSSDGKWKLFKGVTDEPTTTVNFAQGSLDALKVGAFEATTVTPSSGVVFSDGTQTKAGVPSITTIATEKSASETLAAGEQDKFIPLSGAVVITLPATGYSTGQSIDFWQSTGTGASFASTNGVIGTPGLKFRTTNSVVTAMKISSGWLVFGDLSA
jgi:hypothetical protein